MSDLKPNEQYLVYLPRMRGGIRLLTMRVFNNKEAAQEYFDILGYMHAEVRLLTNMSIPRIVTDSFLKRELIGA